MNTRLEHHANGQIAVVGAGYWGVNHVRNIYELGGLNLVCDTRRSSLDKDAEQFTGVGIENAFRSVLENVSVRGVVIATPAETHYKMAAAAIGAGKDVLVEKPLTLEVAEGERLVRLAAERGAIL